MAFAIGTSRGINQRERIVGRRKSPRGISLGTAIIGTGVVAFAWAVATAMTLQSVAVSFSPNHASLQTSLSPLALARLDTRPKTTHTSPRLVAAMTPIVPTSAAPELAALWPTQITKSGRLADNGTPVADAGQQEAASPLVHGVRPRQEDVTAALRLAFAAVPKNTIATPISVALAGPTAAASAAPAEHPVQVAIIDPKLYNRPQAVHGSLGHDKDRCLADQDGDPASAAGRCSRSDPAGPA
jgi:hypothetical protein